MLLALRLRAHIFRLDGDGSHASHCAEAFYEIASLERMGSIRDVGMQVKRAPDCEKGKQLILEYMSLYWTCMKRHFFVPEFKGTSISLQKARFDYAACVEATMRLHFPENHAVRIFGPLLEHIINSSADFCLRCRLAVSVSLRVMTAVN